MTMTYYNRNQGPFPGWNRPGDKSPREPLPKEEGGWQKPSPEEQETPVGNEKKDDWQNDPSLKNMDLKKLAFLSELVSQSGGKSPEALLSFLVTANQNANSMGLQFSDSETDLILNVLKSRMSPEAQSQIELFRKMADLLGKKKF